MNIHIHIYIYIIMNIYIYIYMHLYNLYTRREAHWEHLPAPAAPCGGGAPKQASPKVAHTRYIDR